MMLMTCEKHEWEPEQAFDVHTVATRLTLRFLQDIGAKASPEKSAHLASRKSDRDLLKKQILPELRKKVPTLTHIRDLGAHLNVGARWVAPTITQRARAAIRDVQTLRSLPTTHQNRVAVLAGKVLPKALYAVSTSPAPAMVIKKLTSHMATCLDPRAARSREPHLVLN
eukprot:10005129-Alexandrium_andersonii.AAC.1